jgi:hypothetical protein
VIVLNLFQRSKLSIYGGLLAKGFGYLDLDFFSRFLRNKIYFKIIQFSDTDTIAPIFQLKKENVLQQSTDIIIPVPKKAMPQSNVTGIERNTRFTRKASSR